MNKEIAIKKLMLDNKLTQSIPDYYAHRLRYYLGLAYTAGYEESRKQNYASHQTRLYVYNKSGELIYDFPSIKKAAEILGLKKNAIHVAVRQNRPTRKGYTFLKIC